MNTTSGTQPAGWPPTSWDDVLRYLERLARQRRFVRAWHGMWWGTLALAISWVLLLVVYKLIPLPYPVLVGCGTATLLFPLIGALRGYMQTERLYQLCTLIDEKLGLQDRLTTAFEWSTQQKDHEWTMILQRDVVQQLSRLNTLLTERLAVPPLARWLLVILAMGVGLGFVPEYRSHQYIEHRRRAQLIREAGERLLQVARVARAEQHLQPEALKEITKQLEQLGTQLKEQQLSPDEALNQLAQLSEELRNQARALDRDQAIEQAEQTAQLLESSDTETEQARQQLRQISEHAGGMEAVESELRNLAARFDQIRQQLADAAGRESGTITPDMLHQLQKELESLAQQAQQAGLSSNHLEKAVQALKDGDLKTALQQLDLSRDVLDELMKTATALNRLKPFTGEFPQIGKTLAERLERKQIVFAISRLRWMARTAENSDAADATLSQLRQETLEALSPARMYGNLRDYLDEAIRNIDAQSRSGAALAYDAAADHLKEMLKECSGKMCMAALNACLGAGARLSMMSQGASGGGKPGRGVGLWSDDSLQLDRPPMTEPADYSNVSRPELEPRGITERSPEGDSTRLNPTFVQGQLRPGAPMPSEKIFGLYIEGQSRIEAQQVITAAQEEANRALGEERIPAPYRETVRRYFQNLTEPEK